MYLRDTKVKRKDMSLSMECHDTIFDEYFCYVQFVKSSRCPCAYVIIAWN